MSGASTAGGLHAEGSTGTSTGATTFGGTATGGTSAISNLVTKTLEQCGLSTVGSSNKRHIDLPSALTGPNWSVKASNCEQGGWDLSKCAGPTATFTSFYTGTTTQYGDLTFWVATIGSTVCCAYESDDATPGIYPAPCGDPD